MTNLQTEAIAHVSSKLVMLLKDRIIEKESPYPVLIICSCRSDNAEEIAAGMVDIRAFDGEEKMGGLRPYIHEAVKQSRQHGLNPFGIVHVFDSYIGKLRYHAKDEPSPQQLKEIMKTESYKSQRRDAIVCNTHLPQGGGTNSVAFPYRKTVTGDIIFDDPIHVGANVAGRLADFFPETISNEPVKN